MIFNLIWHSLLLRIYLPFANFTSGSDSIETSSQFRMRVPLRQGSVRRLLETYNLIDTSPSQRLSRTQRGNRLLWRQDFMHTQAAVWVPLTHTHTLTHTDIHTQTHTHIKAPAPHALLAVQFMHLEVDSESLASVVFQLMIFPLYVSSV